MKHAALPLTLLAAFLLAASVGCTSSTRNPAGGPAPAASPAHAYAPSPRRIVGYIMSIDEARGFAIIELADDLTSDQLTEGTVLLVRTADLHPTATLAASRFLRGRTLGTKILTGLPAVGEEVAVTSP